MQYLDYKYKFFLTSDLLRYFWHGKPWSSKIYSQNIIIAPIFSRNTRNNLRIYYTVYYYTGTIPFFLIPTLCLKLHEIFSKNHRIKIGFGTGNYLVLTYHIEFSISNIIKVGIFLQIGTMGNVPSVNFMALFAVKL